MKKPGPLTRVQNDVQDTIINWSTCIMSSPFPPKSFATIPAGRRQFVPPDLYCVCPQSESLTMFGRFAVHANELMPSYYFARVGVCVNADIRCVRQVCDQHVSVWDLCGTRTVPKMDIDGEPIHNAFAGTSCVRLCIRSDSVTLL